MDRLVAAIVAQISTQLSAALPEAQSPTEIANPARLRVPDAVLQHLGSNSITTAVMPPAVQTFIADLTGKASDESDSSSEEQDSFSFMLTPEKVTTIKDREYLDFTTICHRHQRSPCGLGDVTASSFGADKSDMSVTDWARIVLAFHAENARWHPCEATALPAYGDLILKREKSGMQWARYDIISRQKRAKQIVRRPRKVKNWSVTDIELYLNCDVPREVYYKGTTTKCAPPQTTQQPSSEGSLFKAGTCW